MVSNLNGPATINLIQGTRALLILPTNLNEPPTIIFKWPLFKWARNNNIVRGGTGPFNLMFANQFKRKTRVKLRVFILKVAY